MNLIECVPNISEGCDQNIINTIASEIEQSDNVQLLHIDSNANANRTVYTFVGNPKGLLDATFKMYCKTIELLDMSQQSGAHPRIGAVDVCPFVPLSEESMPTCITLSNQLGQKVGEELHIPVYLYEEAATSSERQNLSIIRKGGYEGLYLKLQDEKWIPDFGPQKMNSRSGATVIGARDILVAFNINLDTDDLLIAKKIAREIRTSGTFERDSSGKIKYDSDGFPKHIPGRLKACKAIGWSMPEYGFVQVSTNLINYRTTPPHIVYETCKEIAEKYNTRVIGCELIGLIPLCALVLAGEYYKTKSGDNQSYSENQLIKHAIKKMELNSVHPFNPQERILEYKIKSIEKGATP